MARGRAEEFKLQAQCVKWLWNEHPETRNCFMLIDNNSDNVVAALQKRAMGQIKGASDTLFVWKGGTYFIEFKTENGKQSDFQIKFQVSVLKQNCSYIIIRNFEQFRRVLGSILEQK